MGFTSLEICKYLTFYLFYMVKIVGNDSFRLNSASETFGGRAAPDTLGEITGISFQYCGHIDANARSCLEQQANTRGSAVTDTY